MISLDKDAELLLYRMAIRGLESKMEEIQKLHNENCDCPKPTNYKDYILIRLVPYQLLLEKLEEEVKRG